MSFPSVSVRYVSAGRSHAWRRRAAAAGALFVTLLVPGCGDSTGPGGGGATLTGTVRAAEASTVLADASVSVGQKSATTGADGRFELADVPVGEVSVRLARPGYADTTVQLNLVRGANNHDFSLSAREIYVSGDNAALVPLGPEPIRAVIIALGGPDVSGFVTGKRISPPDRPAALESSLQSLGTSLRALARSSRVALLGSSVIAMPSSVASDDRILNAVTSLATLSGHPELANAPLLLIGLSAGSPEAAGLVSRHPERSIGLMVRVPTSVAQLHAPEALAVPTFVMQAEEDTRNNDRVRPVFEDNRARNGLWALAVEPGIDHAEPTSDGNAAMVGWIGAALARRLPAAPGGPLTSLGESTGWLGHQTTLEIAPWDAFTGIRTQASWLLSETVALAWQNLGTDEEEGTPE